MSSKILKIIKLYSKRNRTYKNYIVKIILTNKFRWCFLYGFLISINLFIVLLKSRATRTCLLTLIFLGGRLELLGPFKPPLMLYYSTYYYLLKELKEGLITHLPFYGWFHKKIQFWQWGIFLYFNNSLNNLCQIRL